MLREHAKQDFFFELSLAVGQSLDIVDNCRGFLDVLLREVDIQRAGIWLNREGAAIESICTLPVQADFSLDAGMLSSVLHAGAHRREKKTTGAYRDFFLLGDVGLLVIDWTEAAPAPGPEDRRLFEQVLEKLTISLEGCLSYERLRNTEQRLSFTERKQRQIIETSLDAVILVDGNACVQEWGTRAEQLFQLSAEEALGHRWYNLVVPYRNWEGQDRHLERFKRFGEFPAKQFSPLELIAIDRSGREFPAEMSYSYLDLEGEAHFCLFIRDISERKAWEAELRNAQTRLRALIANMQAGILVESEDRRIVLVNQYFCNIFDSSLPPNALLGQDCSQAAEQFKALFEDPEGFVNGIDALLAKREIKTREVLRFRDGRIYERDYIPIYVKEAYLGHMWQYRDVTEQKHREQELRKAKRAAEAAKQAGRKFLTNMSHEIRTPMNTVIGMIHLLADTRLDDSQQEYLEALRFSADSLLGVINNVLDLSKIEAGEIHFEVHPFQLRPLLESIRKSYQLELDGRPVRVNLSIDPAIDRHLIGDHNRLSQIIHNLMSNAVKFTEQGSIDLEVRIRADHPEAYVLEFAVRDTGIGMPAHQLPTIFENFKQLGPDTSHRYGGSGLGLSIVKQLVELQDGKIEVESQTGKGSTFRFTLPFKKASRENLPANERTAKKAAGPAEAVLDHIQVLVVEDTPLNQLLVSRILDRWQCRYQVAADGQEAIRRLARTTYDLILMDLRMPGFSGYDLAVHLRRQPDHPNRHTPVVAITAAALPEERKRALKAGINDILTKPFSPRALYEFILKWTGDPPKEGEPNVNGRPRNEATGSLASFRYLHHFSKGDEGFIREMIEAFLVEAPQGLEEMEQAVAAKDWEGLRRTAHRLKPSYEMVELKSLKTKLEALEEMLKSKPVAQKAVAQLLREICAESWKAMEEIRAKL